MSASQTLTASFRTPIPAAAQAQGGFASAQMFTATATPNNTIHAHGAPMFVPQPQAGAPTAQHFYAPPVAGAASPCWPHMGVNGFGQHMGGGAQSHMQASNLNMHLLLNPAAAAQGLYQYPFNTAAMSAFNMSTSPYLTALSPQHASFYATTATTTERMAPAPALQAVQLPNGAICFAPPALNLLPPHVSMSAIPAPYYQAQPPTTPNTLSRHPTMSAFSHPLGAAVVSRPTAGKSLDAPAHLKPSAPTVSHSAASKSKPVTVSLSHPTAPAAQGETLKNSTNVTVPNSPCTSVGVGNESDETSQRAHQEKEDRGVAQVPAIRVASVEQKQCMHSHEESAEYDPEDEDEEGDDYDEEDNEHAADETFETDADGVGVSVRPQGELKVTEREINDAMKLSFTWVHEKRQPYHVTHKSARPTAPHKRDIYDRMAEALSVHGKQKSRLLQNRQSLVALKAKAAALRLLVQQQQEQQQGLTTVSMTKSVTHAQKNACSPALLAAPCAADVALALTRMREPLA
eukprot:m.207307 g.207307  ORF g.207307 m.207307 type:complete len:517 (+) comp15542_c0_seq5:813-2363(+)